jgi:hypothetical protein
MLKGTMITGLASDGAECDCCYLCKRTKKDGTKQIERNGPVKMNLSFKMIQFKSRKGPPICNYLLCEECWSLLEIMAKGPEHYEIIR